MLLIATRSEDVAKKPLGRRPRSPPARKIGRDRFRRKGFLQRHRTTQDKPRVTRFATTDARRRKFRAMQQERTHSGASAKGQTRLVQSITIGAFRMWNRPYASINRGLARANLKRVLAACPLCARSGRSGIVATQCGLRARARSTKMARGEPTRVLHLRQRGPPSVDDNRNSVSQH
jgi:hypothetical protein